MYNESVSIKKSVAASLIKKVFGIYFVLTIMVTLTQLSIEYFHVKESIIKDIMKMEKTFEPGISGTLWDYDWRNLRLILFGMNELSAVVGVRIDNAQGTEIGAAGVILRGERQVHVAPDEESFASSSDTSFTPMRGLFSHSFDVDYENTVNGKAYVVGKATIYSSSGVVIDRIKYGFFLIIVNSVIKTAGLWVIIFFFARRIIGRPLAVLTESAEQMNPNNPGFSEIRRSSEEKRLLQSENELGILARSFDRMRDAILERMDNLHRVRDVGEDLAVIRDIPATFARVVGTMGEKFAFGKGRLFLPDSQNVLRPEGEDGDTDTSCLRMEAETARTAAEKGEMLLVPDIRNHPDAAGEASASESLLCVPLTDEEGLSGVMSFSGGQFDLTDENRVFVEAVARLTAISMRNIRMLEMAEEHAMLTQEMEIAKQIQSALLPDRPKMDGYDISASLTPAEEVGGDYYDVISVGEYDWLVIGDVSGHGVTAGLVMMMVQTAIHTVLLGNPGVTPSHLLSVINRTIYNNIERIGECKHMTIIVLAAGWDGYFSFSGLHEDVLIRRSETGKVDRVETDGMWIGIEPDISPMLSDRSLRLELGDCMVLFTDGITEAWGKENNQFGDERLMRIIEESGDTSASQVHENIIAALEPWKKSDDITLLVMKRVHAETDDKKRTDPQTCF